MDGPSERLEHDGVRLRRWRPEDADALCAAVQESLEHLRPWLGWARRDYAYPDAVEFLARADREWEAGQAYHYAIVTAAGGVAGACGLMAWPEPGPELGPGVGLEIGYWLHAAHTGRGVVTRAVAAVTAEAFRIGADWVQIKHDQANRRSAAVPPRLGFVTVARRPALEPVIAGGDTGIDLIWRLERPDRTGRGEPAIARLAQPAAGS